jgi:hypothetical protein
MKLPPGWEIPTQIRRRFGNRSGRQRSIDSDGHVVLVVHQLPEKNSLAREGVYFWRKPGGEWENTERGQSLQPLVGILANYEAALDRYCEEIEQAVSIQPLFAIVRNLGPVNRAIRNLHETLAAARDGVNHDEDRAPLQNLIDDSGDLARNAELMAEDVRHSIDLYQAQQIESQAEHSRELERAGHRLNSLAALFLPLTAVASLFGMNLKNGLENAPTWTFWAVLAGSVVAGKIVSETLSSVRGRNRLRTNSG